MKLFFVSLAAIGMCNPPSSSHVPPPEPPIVVVDAAGPATCEQRCSKLQALGCSEGLLPECPAVCQDLADSTQLSVLDVACLDRARTRVDVQQCGEGLCQ